MKKSILPFIALAALAAGCQNASNNTKDMEKYKKGSFGYDLNFLKENDKVILLQTEAGNSKIIVSAKYQGKIFTSTADGMQGRSFGWINYKAFKAEKDAHMNAYGGEDRLWLGPEGGKYSLYFKPGTKMEFGNWHTPAAIDTESWTLNSSTGKSVAMSKAMSLVNYAGTNLELLINRNITILENAEIEQKLDIQLSNEVKCVGFNTVNTLTNTSTIAWNEKTGAPCMWNLDMFMPAAKTVIVIPYDEQATGKVATTDYFGQIPPHRVHYKNGTLYFKADGKSRGKLGLPPNRAKNFAGSYDPEHHVLTITHFDVDKKGIYLNQEWTPDKDPLTGDAVNAYNDGTLQDGTQMGPFYEIESVSPAAFLKPGAKLSHQHSVFHFTGDENTLDTLAKKLLGVSLNDIEKAFD